MLPQAVRYVLERLEDAGFAAYAVGGCVRDTLLGRTPEDWDVTTAALEVPFLWNSFLMKNKEMCLPSFLVPIIPISLFSSKAP